MSSRLAPALRAAVLVAGLAVVVLLVRWLLDVTIARSGWYLVPFLAVLVATRTAGRRAGMSMIVVLVAADLALATVNPSAFAGPAGMAMGVHLALDVVSAFAALLTAITLRTAGTRERESSLAAERAGRRLLGAARREAAARHLASEVSDPRSVRQVADRFAERAREMMGASSVTVSDARSRGDGRAAGGLADGPLAVSGVPEPGDPELGPLVAEAITGGRPRWLPGSGRIALPLLAGTVTVAAAVVRLDPPRVVEAEELDGLSLLGRIAGEAAGRLDLAADSRREARRAAAAADRIARLQRLAADLGRELDAVAIGRLVVDAALEGTGAAAGVLHRVDHARGEMELLHARGYPAGLVDRERRLPLAAALPGALAARESRTVVVAAGAWAAAFPGASDVPAIAGLDEVAAIPLGHGAPAAVLLVGRAGGEPFDRDDTGFLEAVAEHGAQAVRRADLVEQLRDRDRRLGLTLGVARAGSWELDVRRREFDASPALRRLHGLPDDAPISGLEAYLGLVDEADRETVRREVERVASGGGSFTLEFRVHRRDGSALRILSVGRTFTDESGRPTRLMAIDRDVTVERAAEDERERLLQQEREERRLSEAFFGVMSHELRTPVTTILAGARILGRGRTLDPEDADVMADIADEAERLHRLIEDLLVLSRLERGNLVLAREPVHLGHLVRRVIAHEARRWPETAFEGPPDGNRDVIDGEETYVEQVLRNLLSNAAKYSPAGSTVRVRIEREGGEVAVRVLDEGPGVGSDEVGDLFSLFYRSPATAAAASGAGIGLFVCDRLIRAMGGRIWARRRTDAPGSEFGFALSPSADEAALGPGEDDQGLEHGREAVAAGPS